MQECLDCTVTRQLELWAGQCEEQLRHLQLQRKKGVGRHTMPGGALLLDWNVGHCMELVDHHPFPFQLSLVELASRLEAKFATSGRDAG